MSRLLLLLWRGERSRLGLRTRLGDVGDKVRLRGGERERLPLEAKLLLLRRGGDRLRERDLERGGGERLLGGGLRL